MLQRLKSFFQQHVEPAPQREAVDSERRLRLAACALLLEVAHADDEFTSDEQAHIEEVLIRHFDLDANTARELMALADQERREATDLHQFTSLINRHYDEGQRMVLAELVWRVVYADGMLSQHESQLARKLASLLDLRPGFLSEARRRAVGDREDAG
jgi:uncharacterized tellurite resistance protein B-like protein